MPKILTFILKEPGAFILPRNVYCFYTKIASNVSKLRYLHYNKYVHTCYKCAHYNKYVQVYKYINIYIVTSIYIILVISIYIITIHLLIHYNKQDTSPKVSGSGMMEHVAKKHNKTSAIDDFLLM